VLGINRRRRSREISYRLKSTNGGKELRKSNHARRDVGAGFGRVFLGTVAKKRLGPLGGNAGEGAAERAETNLLAGRGILD